MAPRILVDLSHTSHSRARTGVQRVSRALIRALADRASPLCFDPYEGAWRPLDSGERANLEPVAPAPSRGARWPWAYRIRGWARRATRGPVPLQGGGFIVPEIFSQAQTARFPQLFRRISGPKIALFHDALALQYPELSPAATVARFPQYLQDLLRFDGVAAVSEASRAALLDYWDWLGIRGAPPVAAFPLGLETPPAGGTVPAKDTPVILSVGSLEARKNHGALLDACESLWASGSQFELVLVGLVNRETGRGALDRIERLRSRSRPIRYEGPLGEAELEAAYRACSFTVYPSLAEGFGLPVAESLARGKPCICRGDGALGEIAAGGGCLLMRSADAAEIASAIGGLLSSKQALGALETAAKARRFKTWSRYADELLAWMGTLGWRADA